jgi:hypothetical protein
MALDGPSLAVQHEELRICCLNATDEGGTKTKNKNQEIRQYNTPTATEVPGTHTPTTIYTLSLQSFAVLSVVVARIDSCISETIKE